MTSIITVPDTSRAAIKARSIADPSSILISQLFVQRWPQRIFARAGRTYQLRCKGAHLAAALLGAFGRTATWDELYTAAYGQKPSGPPAKREAFDYPLRDARTALKAMGIETAPVAAVGIAVRLADEVLP